MERCEMALFADKYISIYVCLRPGAYNSQKAGI